MRGEEKTACTFASELPAYQDAVEPSLLVQLLSLGGYETVGRDVFKRCGEGT